MVVPQVRSGYDDLCVEELRARGSNKWRRYGEEVLPAWVAEMDFPLAPVIRQALEEAVRRNFAGYPPGDAATGVPEAVASWFVTTTSLRVDAGQVRLLPDVLKGMELAIEVFSPPGSAVVVTPPVYGPFFAVARLCGRPIVEVPVQDTAGRYELDLAGIDQALAAGARTLILCNPHNPLGRVYRPEELGALADLVQVHGARVIADEVHGPLTYPDATYTPYASVSPSAASHSVTLTSASKGWNVPGLKCAEIILTNPADLELWSLLPGLRTHGASSLGIVANRVAFAQGQPWLRETISYLDGNRRRLGELLAEHLPAVGYRPPEGTYLAWLDCRRLGLEQPCAFFLERARVAVSDGAAFGPPGAGFVRFNFATSASLLERIVRAMANAVT